MENRASIDFIVCLFILITIFGTWITVTATDMYVWAVPGNALDLLNGEIRYDGFGFLGDVPNDIRYGPVGWGTGILGIMLFIFLISNLIFIFFNKNNRFISLINIFNVCILLTIILFDVGIYILAEIAQVVPIYKQLYYISLIGAIFLVILTSLRLIGII